MATSPAPLWTLEGLRSADPVLALAVLVLVSLLIAESLHGFWRLPRACGHMLTGALAGPLLLHVVERAELDPWKPLIDLAVGALLFELGTRIRPRWLIDNPALAATALLQAALVGITVALVLGAFGVPAASAAVAGAVALASSPVIVLSSVNELKSRGQVTERLLLITAVNSVVAVLALKALPIALAADAVEGRVADDMLGALADALRVISGSFLLGVVAGFALDRLSPLVRGTPAMPVLLISLVIIASLLAVQWTLSPLLALLIAGMTARARMRHGLTVEPHLGSAGAALNVLLFITLGVLFAADGFATAWPLVLAIIVARLVASALAVGAFARASGIGWRQAGALALALQPMSSLAVLLAADGFAIHRQLPGVDPAMLNALLIAVTLMQLSGPIWTEGALQRLAGEGPER